MSESASIGNLESGADAGAADAAGDRASRAITPEQRVDALRELNSGSKIEFMWEWMKIIVIAVMLFVVLHTFVVQAYIIPSGSMENTLQVGDFLLVNKLIYGAEVPFTHYRLPAVRAPRRGDVIVFDYPVDPSKTFVKRLVGIPGDTLEMRDGVLVRNGETLPERYVEHDDPYMDPAEEEFRWQRNYLVKTAAAAVSYHPSRNNWGPLVVPVGNYFVLGDNRDNSLDSRYWGFVADSLVRGRPFVIYYSYAPDTASAMAWLSRVRWSRLGARIR